MPRKLRNPENKIATTLTNSGNLTWLELLKLTGLSKGALSKYINQMIEADKIKVVIDNPRKPRKKLYALAVTLPKNAEETSHDNPVSLATYMAYLIPKIENRDIARKEFDRQLRISTGSLICNILNGLVQTTMDSDGSIILKRIKQGKESAKLSEDISQLWEKCSKKLNVNSIVESIFWLIFKNTDIAFGQYSPLSALVKEKQDLKITRTDEEVTALDIAQDKLSKESL